MMRAVTLVEPLKPRHRHRYFRCERALTRCKRSVRERGGGEQREQEVPGHPVARLADEEHREERLVAEQEHRERREEARHEEEARSQREQVERDHVGRLRASCEACRASCPRPAGRASRRRSAARATARRAGRARALSPGWWTQNEITLRWKVVICAHSSYGTTTPVFCQCSNTSCGVGGNDFGCGTWSIQPPCFSVSYVLTLFAFQSARASVVTAQQPTLTLFRTTHGMTATAAPAKSAHVASSVRRETPARHSRYAPRRIGSASRRTLPRIPSPITAPSGSARCQPKRSAACSVRYTVAAASRWSRISRFMCTSCQTRYGCSATISACEQADRRREPALADLPDDERRRDGDADLREPDDLPVPAEDPVERDQEPAVERLRVRGRVARDEAVRPVARNVRAKSSPLSVNDARMAPRSWRSAGEARQRGGEDEEEGGAARAHEAHAHRR